MFVQRGKCTVVLGGQFGSEGKGLAAAWLARRSAAPEWAVTNAGAQAGHTTVREDDTKFVTYHLPTVGVMNRDQGTRSYVCAGSIIDVDQFVKEMVDCGMPEEKVWVHPRAAVITPEAKAEERDAASSTARLASTQKGVGATIAAKVMRRAVLAKDVARLSKMISKPNFNDLLQMGMSVTMEIPQGTALSLNHGVDYPHCTSRDCWVASGLNDAGINPHFLGDVMMVVRSFPIRVGNLMDDDGNVIGESGPFGKGSFELDWAKHFDGIEPERTTVTKRVRRIATWSDEQYKDAVSLNRPTLVFLNFVNYYESWTEFEARVKAMRYIHEWVGINPKMVFGIGPRIDQVGMDLDPIRAYFETRTKRG